MFPAAERSAVTLFRSANRSVVSLIVTFSATVFKLLFASVLARRISERVSAVKSNTAGSTPFVSSLMGADSGHLAWCIDPDFHQDQTSSVTNGRNGAKSLSKVSTAIDKVA